MRKIIVKVDKEKATELERVNFELNFVKDIVQRVIESHPSDLELINGDTLMSYNKRGAELQRKYVVLQMRWKRNTSQNTSKVISIVGLFQIILMK